MVKKIDRKDPEVIMAWIDIALKILPLVAGSVAVVEKLASTLVKSDDKDKNKKKQDAAVDAIGIMISTMELSFDREIMNVPEFQTLLRRLIDDYVAIQNFVRDFKKEENAK